MLDRLDRMAIKTLLLKSEESLGELKTLATYIQSTKGFTAKPLEREKISFSTEAIHEYVESCESLTKSLKILLELK